MPVYSCRIGTSDGRILQREIDASDAVVLKSELEDQGFYVFNVKKRPLHFLFSRSATKRLDNKTLLILNQEMLVLLKSGMPIVQALDAVLEKDGHDRLHELITQVREDVRGGAALSAAMERHGRAFPHLYIASIKAGERTGDLPRTLRRYIQYLKRVDGIRKKIISALFYPAILILFALMAITLLLVYVVPTFSQVYADAGSTLPLPTQMLIAFTGFLKRYFLLGIFLAVAGAGAFRSWANREDGRFVVDRMKIRMPYVGDIFSKYSVAAFTRTLATVLGSGIPIIESLRMSVGTLNNRFIEKKMFEAIRYVEEGGRVTAAFERVGVMPSLALRMLGVGEATGALEDMLLDISDYLEDELEERMHILTTAIEPAVMVIMGVVIGVIIIAMYLPVFRIAGTVS